MHARTARPRPAMTPGLAYRDAEAHLRDELFRVWLRLEYEVRRRARVDDRGRGRFDPTDLDLVFRAAHCEYRGIERPARAGEQALLDAFLAHSSVVEARIHASAAAGVELPLLQIVRTFSLTRLQRVALTFALMPEVDPDLLMVMRTLGGDAASRGLDVRLLAMLVYDTPESRTELVRDLSARSPLVRFRLLELEEARGIESSLSRGLRPAARLVELLGGRAAEIDPTLVEIAELRDRCEPGQLPRDLIDQAALALRASEGVLLAIQGPRGVGKKLLVQMAAARLGRRTLMIDARALAATMSSAASVTARSLLREARLLDAIPVLCDTEGALNAIEAGGERSGIPSAAAQLCREHEGAVALTFTGERMPPIEGRAVVRLQLGLPGLAERVEIWRREVPTLTSDDAQLLADRFATAPGTIVQAVRATSSGDRAASPPSLLELDVAVRAQLHDRVARLGRRMETPWTFDDLIVSHEVWSTLCEISAAMCDRRRVRETWGIRGAPGVSVLFSGDPGVGKTMSATVLARSLNLAIYEVDLSRVMSKWIGETEKNLSEIFDAAEPGHVVLLFNEADSLFGKRTTEVRTANDRHANLEINHLLQRLERFGGLAILTTNLGKAIDPAFRRRFAYDVQFSPPTAEMRSELWRRTIPPGAAAADIDFHHLGERYALSGAFIKVAVERSAFLAAAEGNLLTAELLEMTIERMYRERGKLTAVGQLE